MYYDVMETGGFSFDNYLRNKMLNKDGKSIKTKKTGTTIVGIVYNEGVILAADTRATEGSIVADPDCMKIHYLAPNIYCCGAGTAADCEFATQMMSSELELHRLNTKTESRMAMVEARLSDKLFKYGGNIGAALIIGGVDVTGPQLILISPHGNTMHLPFGTMGSGSLAAMGILETRYKDNMNEQEAVDLAKSAIEAGIFHDLGSGSNVDIFVVKRDGCKKLENYRVYNQKTFSNSQNYVFPKGTSQVLESFDYKWNKIEVVEDKMEIV